MFVRAVPLLSAVMLLLLGGCGTEPTPADGPAATPTTAPPSTAPPSTAPPVGTVPEPAGRTVQLSYSEGRVSGDTGRVPIPLGTRVTLVVSGDRADEVHVHGYDRTVEVPAGGNVTLTFTADIPGVFDVELHDSGLLLTQLEVG